MIKIGKLVLTLAAILSAMVLPPAVFAQAAASSFDRDRGAGLPTSQFGTYIHKNEFLAYLFFEYYYDHNLEYEPNDFGFGPITEYRGRYEANEQLIFLAYGISEKLALEFEAGFISARLGKSAKDDSPMPPELNEAGLSDVEGQIRWRWNFESATRPEFFNYFEYVLPLSEKNSLIGTSHWELKLGLGIIKGFEWGTLTARVAADYDGGENVVGVGEYAVEYLKRFSNRFRLFVMMEGADDEIAIVPEIQWFFGRGFRLKAGSGIGLTSKATDVAPEVGLMYSFGNR